MGWISATLVTDAATAEALADALGDAGALSASIEDADAGTERETPQFGEPGSITTIGWERSKLVVLFAEDDDISSIIASASAKIGIKTVPEFSLASVADQDWVRLTQSQFAPIRVSDRLWIVPSWHDAPDPSAINIVLDPGLAFGTGSHPTTHLCLEWLEREVDTGCSVLDVGCGSGILAIAAARLGAGSVVGTDIDPQALTAARSNGEINRVDLRVEDAASFRPGEYDLVVANILANPLRTLAPALCGYVRPGGRLALAGLLDEQAEELIAIYSPWLQMGIGGRRDGWTLLVGTRKPPSPERPA